LYAIIKRKKNIPSFRKREMMKKKSLLSLICLWFLFLTSGCKEADSILMPIHKTTEEVNRTRGKLVIPVGVVTDANLRFKESSFVVEKSF